MAKIHEASASSPRYLVVAKNIHIGGGAYYDIIFGIYVNKDFALTFPKVDKAYYIKLYPLKLDAEQGASRNGMTSFTKTYIDMVGHSIFGAYNADNPIAPYVFSVNNPLNLLTRKKLLEAVQKKSFPERELKVLLKASVSLMELAHIEEGDIARHDKVTVGLIGEMRRMLHDNRRR